jgi:arylsulfatase A-like enzyme
MVQRIMTDRPNVVFILLDQLRGDSIGADPHAPRDSAGQPIVHTPHIDYFADQGALFSRAYSPAPTCVPARRCLWTGQSPASCGSTGWTDDPWDFEHTLPAELTAAGYQTGLVGKSHAYPLRNRFGFERIEQHAGNPLWEKSDHTDDYTRWLQRHTDNLTTEYGGGLTYNTGDARPWHLPEKYHPTNWTTRRAQEFIETRDPTRPFFLTVSYVRPHPPLDPPQAYLDMYANRDLPDPVVGDWVADLYGLDPGEKPVYATTKRGASPDFWLYDAPDALARRVRAAYWALVTHVDHQIRRVIRTLEIAGEFEHTLFVLTSDHGTMLGEHHHWSLSHGFEGTARVPFLVKLPETVESERGVQIDRLVGLEDLMPTVLDAVGVDIPETVDGESVLGLIDDPTGADWREHYHGEHEAVYHPDNATQYVVAEGMKYIWNPATGGEVLFDLEADPKETTDLTGEANYEEIYTDLRQRLIDELSGRPEEFTDGDQLLARRRSSFIHFSEDDSEE